MRLRMLSIVFGAVVALATAAIANEAASTHAETSGEAVNPTEGFPHPEISPDGGWAGGLAVVIILCFFLPAAVIGPIVRANTPEEVPPTHSHDEPPGTSGHHGPSGTHAEPPHH